MTILKQSVLIVGAGEFGAGTAASLLRTGNYTDVTVIDRAPVLPAMDAASCDINKVVRWDYADPDYAKLALQAIEEWNKDDWRGIYYQSGVIISGLERDDVHGLAGRNAYKNTSAVEPSVTLIDTPEEYVRRVAPSPEIKAAVPPTAARAYHNPIGGWANAAKAVEKLYEFINELGGKIVAGAEMSELLLTEDGKDVRGVRCADGREFTADKVVVALGSWTPSHPALSGLVAQGLLTATGQTIAAIQLTPEDAKKYADIPVSMIMDGSGYYSFPPNEHGVLKFALHAAGYLSDTGVPRTALDPKAVRYTQQNEVGWIPSESLDILRERLYGIYPELSKYPVTFTRMCWYSDVVDGNWVIDYAPQYPSLLLATGGAGHAFKFLPIMGDLIRQRLEGTLDPAYVKKWRADRPSAYEDPARTGMQRKPLVLDKLATVQQLAVTA